MFDAGVLKSVPHYQEMISVITSILPFKRTEKVALLDIGTGTGNIAYNLKRSFPASKLLCLDLSPKMIEVAKEKLKGFKGVEYVVADAASFTLKQKYDAIVSSLTLHHLETDKEKHAFHRKVFKALNPGGYFINADILIAEDQHVQDVNLAKWKAFILKASTPAFAKDRYKKYLAEDRPAVLFEELSSLREAGFKGVEVYWKYYNFAVYGGQKK